MQQTAFNLFSKRTLLLSGALIVFLGGLLLISSNLEDKSADKDSAPKISKNTDRATARVYIKKFDRYIEFSEPDTRFDVERMLYNYSYILDGNDLYTGIIRPESFERTVTADGRLYRTHMLIDIIPTNVTYRISIIKDKNMNYKEGSYVLCATPAEQRDQTEKCIDEGGR